jgi:hypothetical protein
MKEVFIVYRPYKDLSTIECLLMSWIISLNDARQTICFSNEYAGKLLKVSDRTIRSSVSKLKSLGHINTFQTRDRRFIYLNNRPEIENISLEVCNIDGVENTSTQEEIISIQGGKDFHTDRKIIPLGEENISTYNKEDNKDNNDTQASYETDLRFNKIVGLFPKSKQKGIQEAFDYTWLFLNDDEKKQIEKILPVYLQRNKDEPKFIKPVNKYFNEKFWITDDISLTLLKENKTKPVKKYKF